MKLYRELGSEPSNAPNSTEEKGKNAQVHDTKTPIILSQKARYMREQQEQAEAQVNQQLVLPRIPANKVASNNHSQPQLIQNLRGLYGRDPSGGSRENDTGVGLARIPSS